MKGLFDPPVDRFEVEVAALASPDPEERITPRNGTRNRRPHFADTPTMTVHAINRPEEGQRTVALGPDSLVIGTPVAGRDPAKVAKAMLDTHAGENDRYASNGDFELLAAELGESAVADGATHPRYGETETTSREGRFAGQVAEGRRGRIEDGTAKVKIVFVFDSAGAASVDPVARWARQSGGRTLTALREVTVGKKGRAIQVTGSGDPEVVFG